MRLSGKTAIVTGGARGIGAGIALCLAEEGVRVALLDVDAVEAEKRARSLGRESIGLAADVSTESAAAEATAKVVARFGGLDIFVNKAGAAKGASPASLGLGTPFTNIN